MAADMQLKKFLEASLTTDPTFHYCFKENQGRGGICSMAMLNVAVCP